LFKGNPEKPLAHLNDALPHVNDEVAETPQANGFGSNEKTKLILWRRLNQTTR
jgi:hypothetical protein